MTPQIIPHSRQKNTILIFVIAVIGVLGVTSLGLIAWVVLFYLPHSPQAFDMYVGRGDYDYQQGDYQLAIEAYTSAIETSPRNCRGYFLRGRTYYKTKAFHAALTDYKTILQYARLKNTQQQAHYACGRCYHGLHDWTHAISEFTACIDLHEKGTYVYMYRGNAYKKLKDYPHALQDLNSAIGTDPASAYLYASRGQVLDSLHKYAPALDDMAFAVRLEPKNALCLGNLGWAQYLAGKEDAAIQTDRNVLQSHNDLGWVHGNLALCYATREDWIDARVEYMRALATVTPTTLGSLKKAIRNALEKKPASPTLQKSLAMLKAAHVPDSPRG